MVRSVRFHRDRSDASATTLQAGRDRPSGSNQSIVSTASTTAANSEAWRKPGKLLRARLVQEDEAHGGKSFTLSPDCPIDRYYRVADKVLDQFLQHPVDTREELMEAYLVGTRLSKFLSVVLATHPDYDSRETLATELRRQSQEQLAAVLHYLEKMAFILDKQEHENYISKVLETDLSDTVPIYNNASLVSPSLEPDELDALDALVEQNESFSGLGATALSSRFEDSEQENSILEQHSQQDRDNASPAQTELWKAQYKAESTKARTPATVARQSQRPVVTPESVSSRKSSDQPWEPSQEAVDWSFSATEEFSEEWLNMSLSVSSSQFDARREQPPKTTAKKRLTAVVEEFDPFSPLGSPQHTTLKMSRVFSHRYAQHGTQEPVDETPSMERRKKPQPSPSQASRGSSSDFGLDNSRTQSMYSPPVRQQVYSESKIERRFREMELDDTTQEYLAQNSALLSSQLPPRDESPTAVINDFAGFYDWTDEDVKQSSYAQRNHPKSSLLHYDKLRSREEDSSRTDLNDTREGSSSMTQRKRGALAPLKACVRCLLE